MSGVRSLHWSDLHQMLLRALPEGVVRFGTMITSVEQAEGGGKVQVKAEKKGPADGTERISAEADLVIAADGSMSNTRQKFVPSVSRRQAPWPWLCLCPHSVQHAKSRPGVTLFSSCGHMPVMRLAPGCVMGACSVAS